MTPGASVNANQACDVTRLIGIPTETDRKKRAAKRPKFGRPNVALDESRSKRVVTFMTERELENLQQIAQEEDRSLSTIVHRIIAQHLRNTRSSENE